MVHKQQSVQIVSPTVLRVSVITTSLQDGHLVTAALRLRLPTYQTEDTVTDLKDTQMYSNHRCMCVCVCESWCNPPSITAPVGLTSANLVCISCCSAMSSCVSWGGGSM